MRVMSEWAALASGTPHRHSLPATGAQAAQHRAAHAVQRQQRMDVLVASRDALAVRQALVALADTHVVHCSPLPHGVKVRLEIHFPMGLHSAVMRQVLARVPTGQFGRVADCAARMPHRATAPEAHHGSH